MASAVSEFLNHPALWKASQARGVRPVAATGYPELDALLHDGGWPQGGLTELLLQRTGVGEWRLLAPLLRKLSSQSGYLALVNPPLVPYSPAMAALGVSPDKTLVIREDEKNMANQPCFSGGKAPLKSHTDRMVWAAYQALVSRSCGAVLLWLPGNQSHKQALRKLALAARQGQCWGIVLRPGQAAIHPSPACLRLSVQGAKDGLCRVEVLKQPGSWGGQKTTLNLLPERRFWSSVEATQWPVFSPVSGSETEYSTPPLHALSDTRLEHSASQWH